MMKRFYERIRGFFKRKRGYSREEIERKLPIDVREAVAREAEFLRGMHGVSVRPLAKGETPDKPKAAATEPPQP